MQAASRVLRKANGKRRREYFSFITDAKVNEMSLEGTKTCEDCPLWSRMEA